MTIGEIIRQGFHYARTCKSLWLFGFFVGLASGGSSSSSSGGGGAGATGSAVAGVPMALSMADVLPVVLAVVGVLLVLGVASILLHFISQGALIEGIVRARKGGTMTLREGVKTGWAHWGVLLRIALLYVATILASIAIVAVPCVLAVRAFGTIGGVLFGIPAVIVAVPWLITLHMTQAFAGRIAVLENRRAFDAVRKARLFLHGRLMHGLKLIVATFVGSLAIALVGAVVILPIVLLLVALASVLHIVPVIVAGCVVLLPACYVFVALLGTFQSSIWTIGYVTEVNA
jgi:hypothetical protein